MIRQLQEEFDRHIEQVNEDPFAVDKKLICFREVIKAHYLIADYFMAEGEQIICGVKDMNILGSSLGRQVTGFGAFNKWESPEEKCATLFFGLIKNHPFHDANKRTALLTLLYHLSKLDRVIDTEQKEFENLAVNVAGDTYEGYKRFKRFREQSDKEVRFISDFLRKNTRKIDKQIYQITFQEFDTLLRKFDVFLENPHGNHIDVTQVKEKKKFFGLKIEKERRKIIQIGFPGWKKQVYPRTLKEVLRIANLTSEHGVDSQSFFKGVEPFGALIDQYSGPLKRLKDK